MYIYIIVLIYWKFALGNKISRFKIHRYQKEAVVNKKFSCQTRLLGLEANLIMAMNSNLKKKEDKNIMEAVKKYCYWSSIT